MSQRKTKRSAGFSLIEVLMVVLLLSIIVAAIFSQIDRAQVRYHVEDQKVDLTQQERDFIDQFTRDLHQTGYPSPALYGNRLDLTSQRTAIGLWSISQTDLNLEADVDGDGIVDEITYHYDAGAGWAGPGPNPCPCLRRSSTPKQDGLLPWAQPAPVYYTQVQNIIPVAGQPIFQAYAFDGTVIDISAPKALGSTTNLGNLNSDPTYELLHNIKNVRITFTTQAIGQDADAHKSVQVTMTGMARLPNN